MLIKVGEYLINPDFVIYGEEVQPPVTSKRILRLVLMTHWDNDRKNDGEIFLHDGDIDDFYSAFKKAIPTPSDGTPPLAEAVTD